MPILAASLVPPDCSPSFDGLKNRQTGSGGALRVVVVGLGIAKERHYSVTKVLGDVATEAGYRFRGRAMVAPHRLAPFLRVELGGDLGRPGQVAEQHRQMAPLAREALAGFSIRTKRRGGSVERRSTLAAELKSRWILRAALGAPILQRRAAVAAELGALGIVAMTSRAAHSPKLQTVPNRVTARYHDWTKKTLPCSNGVF
jgi:hypothetical protein